MAVVVPYNASFVDEGHPRISVTSDVVVEALFIVGTLNKFYIIISLFLSLFILSVFTGINKLTILNIPFCVHNTYLCREFDGHRY